MSDSRKAAGGPAGRRGLGLAVAACVAGAALAIFAATRTWVVTVTPRPGLPELRTTATGASAQPWIAALAVVALAGAGALLATRGVVRRGLGVLLVLVGAATAVAAIVARAALGGGDLWAGAGILGAASIVVGGLGAARRGHLWPGMSSRYERTTVPGSDDGVGGGSEPFEDAGSSRPVTHDTRAAWDALDRGEDPTEA
jgi:hypothetical protein